MESSSKRERIVAGAVRALHADRKRSETAAKATVNERSSKTYVLLPKMAVRQ